MQLNNNAYYTGLTNLALYIAMYTTNKSNRTAATIDKFTTEPLAYGDTKIFRSLPFPQVSDYSKTSSLLGDHTPSFTPTGEANAVNVVEDVISINNRKIIKNSYSLKNLELAITSEYGANEFIAIALGNIEAAKNDFLYDLIVNKLYSSNYGKTSKIKLLDLTNITTPTEIQAGELINQKKISLGIQKEIDSFLHYSTGFNKYGLKQSVDLSDMRLVVFQPYKNEAVVNMFAELLNSGYISENFPRPELITIPEEKAKAATDYDENYICVLMHKAAIQMFYKLLYMGEFFDVSTLRVNNFLHFWFGLGQVEQLPTCLITVDNDQTGGDTGTGTGGDTGPGTGGDTGPGTGGDTGTGT